MASRIFNLRYSSKKKKLLNNYLDFDSSLKYCGKKCRNVFIPGKLERHFKKYNDAMAQWIKIMQF